jgi:predicted O-linked N-acetylglucosamine transferase (SPINDLY family)
MAIAQRATEVDPGSAESWATLSAIQTKLKQNDAALAAAERAVAAAPSSPPALIARAAAHCEMRRHDLAIADYEAALRINPQEKGMAGLIAMAKLFSCDWSGLAGYLQRALAELRAGSDAVTPFLLSAFPGATPADHLLCAQITVRSEYPPLPPLYRGERYRHDRIRLAYVSGDYHRHPTTLLMAGVYDHHDHSRFETYAISFGPDDGSIERQRAVRAFDHFIDVSDRGSPDIARLMREHEIDVAVDLGSFTTGGRLLVFAARPAPVQVSYLGFPGTTGAPYMDYLLADRVVIPEESRRFYSEQIVTLPGSYQANDDTQPIAATPTRAAAGLPPDGVVFASFNNTFKITPAIFAIWMRLLRDVPDSSLWLLAGQHAAPGNLRNEAARAGIEPDRLIFAQQLPRDQHLARLRLADIFLDTLPYNAHTTAADALWAGLPVVTCPGDTFQSRVAASLLTAIGLPELITSSLEGYAALAARLARDPAALATVKAKLAANRNTTALFDTARFTRHLEAAYATMIERHWRGEAPAAFAVPE